MKEVNVVVWGLGPHAIKNILPALESCTGVNLYGVCSRNAEIVTRYAAQMKCLGWNNSEHMLDDPKVDVVYLSTPIGLHASQGRSVLLANKHLWCEKPLTENLEQTMMLVNLSRERNVSLAEGFMYLYHPQFFYLQEVLHSQMLGRIYNITCRLGIPTLDRPGFRTDPQLGGGALLDVGSYPISAATSFFPKLNPEVLFTEIMLDTESPVDSRGRSILRYEAEVNVTLEWGINCSYRNEVDFWGSKGSLSSEYFFSKSANHIPRFKLLDRSGRESYKTCQPGNHFLAMLNVFRKFADSSVDAENERVMIIRRAQLMDKIKRARI